MTHEYERARGRADSPTGTPWLAAGAGRDARARARLFCLPYVGGSASIYRGWQQSLPAAVEVCAVELPGRGGRIKEKPYASLSLLVDALSEAILPLLDRPFAFFGHSLGALIAFETARRLQQEYQLEPSELFVSGRRAPQLPYNGPPTYDLPEPEFIERLRQLHGTPGEVLEHSELMGLMIPMLRADFSVAETYVYAAGPPLGCPVTAFGGLDDPEVGRAQLEAWREQTNASFSLRMMPGDHFFLHTNSQPLLRFISQHLHRLL